MKTALSILVAATLAAAVGCAGVRKTPELAAAPSDPARAATLGLTTSVPPDAVAAELGLSRDVRVRGRRVDAIEAGGPASRAGVRVGDVIVRLGDNDLYSADDVADFLSVAAPGDEVGVLFRRPGEGERKTVATLGADSRPPDSAASGPRLRWRFASLGQMPRALAAARAAGKKVLVGLSGAET